MKSSTAMFVRSSEITRWTLPPPINTLSGPGLKERWTSRRRYPISPPDRSRLLEDALTTSMDIQPQLWFMDAESTTSASLSGDPNRRIRQRGWADLRPNQRNAATTFSNGNQPGSPIAPFPKSAPSNCAILRSHSPPTQTRSSRRQEAHVALVPVWKDLDVPNPFHTINNRRTHLSFGMSGGGTLSMFGSYLLPGFVSRLSGELHLFASNLLAALLTVQ